jgi:hypothetical protein
MLCYHGGLSAKGGGCQRERQICSQADLNPTYSVQWGWVYFHAPWPPNPSVRLCFSGTNSREISNLTFNHDHGTRQRIDLSGSVFECYSPLKQLHLRITLPSAGQI